MDLFQIIAVFCLAVIAFQLYAIKANIGTVAAALSQLREKDFTPEQRKISS